jgi:hypothetical protein
MIMAEGMYPREERKIGAKGGPGRITMHCAEEVLLSGSGKKVGVESSRRHGLSREEKGSAACVAA